MVFFRNKLIALAFNRQISFICWQRNIIDMLLKSSSIQSAFHCFCFLDLLYFILYYWVVFNYFVFGLISMYLKDRFFFVLLYSLESRIFFCFCLLFSLKLLKVLVNFPIYLFPNRFYNELFLFRKRLHCYLSLTGIIFLLLLSIELFFKWTTIQVKK